MVLATWFGSGQIKFAPGTFGSLAALPFAWLIYGNFNAQGLAVVTLVVFLIGIWAADIHAQQLPDEDPSEIVIDEVVGMWLTLLVVPPDVVLYIIGFVFFRIADIWKPWPVSWADQAIKGGAGIMLDDIFAGAYAALALFGGSYRVSIARE